METVPIRDPVEDLPRAETPLTPPAASPGETPTVALSLAVEKAALEVKKLEAEIEKITHETASAKSWWHTSVRNVPLPTWLTAVATVGLLIAGWYTGFFNAVRERLESDKNRLAMEKIEHERHNEKLIAEKQGMERQLAEMNARWKPVEEEERGLADLRGSHKEGLRVALAGSPFFDDMKVSITHQLLPWSEAFTGPAQNSHTTLSPSLTKAVQSANRFRKLHGIRVRELVVSRDTAELLTAHDNLVLLTIECGEVDQSVAGGLRGTKQLRTLALPGNRIFSFDGVQPMTSVELLDLSNNPIGDGGIASLVTAVPNLGAISLAGTGVTDAGIQHLTKLQGLAYIDVQRTRVTGQGLVKALDCPLMHIIRADNRILTDTIRTTLKAQSPDLHIYGEDFTADQPFANW